jgi:di/tricarboxylate transporter
LIAIGWFRRLRGSDFIEHGRLVHPGTTFLPFIAMSTACASPYAYCMVNGTPPNAIVYASGYLQPKDYLRVGVIMWIVANVFLLLLTMGYWVVRGFGESRFPSKGAPFLV